MRTLYKLTVKLPDGSAGVVALRPGTPGGYAPGLAGPDDPCLPMDARRMVEVGKRVLAAYPGARLRPVRWGEAAG